MGQVTLWAVATATLDEVPPSIDLKGMNKTLLQNLGTLPYLKKKSFISVCIFPYYVYFYVTGMVIANEFVMVLVFPLNISAGELG